MRFAVLLLVLVLPLAGCSTPPSSPPATPPAAPPPPPPAPLPEDIDETDTVSGVDVQNFAMQPICSNPASACIHHTFTVGNGSNVTIATTLTWGVPASDLDLYLLQDGGAVAMSAGMPPATQETFTFTMLPGDYDLVVVPWLVVNDTYHLVATFAYEEPPAGNATARRA